MKVILLDIDGVMNKTNTPSLGMVGCLDRELVDRFNKLARDTNAKVVLTSVWRKHPGWVAVLLAGGFDMDRFIGNTPGDSKTTKTRGEEIAEWFELAKNSGVTIERYAIIDDNDDMLEEQKPSFFQTNADHGLTEEIAADIEKHLNS